VQHQPTCAVAGQARSNGRASDERARATTAFLEGELASGALTVANLEARAREAGLLGKLQNITNAKIFKSAKLKLGIRSRRDGFGRGGEWVWDLPPKPKTTMVETAANNAPPGVPVSVIYGEDYSPPDSALKAPPAVIYDEDHCLLSGRDSITFSPSPRRKLTLSNPSLLATSPFLRKRNFGPQRQRARKRHFSVHAPLRRLTWHSEARQTQAISLHQEISADSGMGGVLIGVQFSYDRSQVHARAALFPRDLSLPEIKSEVLMVQSSELWVGHDATHGPNST
jgi:hypothetical protein